MRVTLSFDVVPTDYHGVVADAEDIKSYMKGEFDGLDVEDPDLGIAFHVSGDVDVSVTE